MTTSTANLAVGYELLRYFRQTKPGKEWGCVGVGYDILRRIGMVRINKSGVDAHSFKKGIAACAYEIAKTHPTND